MEQKVKTALIASGSGTDAYSIMTAYNNKQMPGIDLRFLISTKSEAGCLDKARSCKIQSIVLDKKEVGSTRAFDQKLSVILSIDDIQLVFLVGCIVKIPHVPGVKFYNIHPADTETAGGLGMYGLKPHKQVLTDIADLIVRGKKTMNDKFYTTPTVHEVEEKYDSGQYLLKMNVEIPRTIIYDFIHNPESSDDAASRLQQHVLPYEWMMLPLAVNAAAKKILEKNKNVKAVKLITAFLIGV